MRPAPADDPRVRAAPRPARVGRRAARGDPADHRRRAGGPRERSGSRPVSRLHAEVAAERSRRSRATSARDAVAQPPRPPPRADPAVAALLPRLRAAADAAGTAADGDRPSTSRPRWSRTRQGGTRLGVRPVRGQAAPHAAGPGGHARRRCWPAPRRSSRPSARRWSASPARSGREWRPGEPVPDDEGALVRGTLDAIAADHPRGGRPRGVLPRGARRGSRRSAAIAASSASWTSRSRSSGRRSSCARSAGRCWTRPDPLDVGQKTFFSITPVARRVDRRRGRVLPARDEQRASCGC